MNNNDFYLIKKSNHDIFQRKHFPKNDCFNIVYAGRIIANKGICQLVRSLNIWPHRNTQLTIVGQIDINFHISQSNAVHITFENFFKREVIGKNLNLNIVMQQALQQKYLREIYWSSDCFVYPSFHEDENFGMAPREAMLCGIPFVVTDFCGLGHLSNARGGIVKTYSTLGGIRFSLKELRIQIEKVSSWNKKQIEENRFFNEDFVMNECNQIHSFNSIKNSIKELLVVPPSSAPENVWRSKKRIETWLEIGPDSFKKAIELAGASPPDGLYVDGDGYPSFGLYSEPHFLQAIQSFYTTFLSPPVVTIGNCYRGFWRVSLLAEEKAVIEFGFPGPRIKRFNSEEWKIIIKLTKKGLNKDLEFWPYNEKAVNLTQTLVDLGYLVPDNI